MPYRFFGMNKPTSGEIFISGERVKINSVNNAMDKKIGYVPEDRLNEKACFLGQSIGSNIVISELKNFASKLGVVDEI